MILLLVMHLASSQKMHMGTFDVCGAFEEANLCNTILIDIGLERCGFATCLYIYNSNFFVYSC